MITLQGVDPHMIANNLTPYEPVHPGELLMEEIEYRGISQRKLSSGIGVCNSVINEILKCKRPINAEIAILIEAALGIEANMLIRMQTDYNMQVARKNSKIISRLSEIRKIAAF